MKLPHVFKTPSHQRYIYKPRFWNEKQEELEKRIRGIEARQDGDIDAIKASVADTFKKGGANRSYMLERKYRTTQIRRSNTRVFMIVIVLSVLVYLLVR